MVNLTLQSGCPDVETPPFVAMIVVAMNVVAMNLQKHYVAFLFFDLTFAVM